MVLFRKLLIFLPGTADKVGRLLPAANTPMVSIRDWKSMAVRKDPVLFFGCEHRTLKIALPS